MVRDDTIMHQYCQYIFWGDPERAPNTRGTGSNFFMYIYIYIYIYIYLYMHVFVGYVITSVRRELNF